MFYATIKMQASRGEKMEITNDIKYIGANDKTLDLFEGKYVVPNGMAYNSYVIFDEKIAILDTTDAKCADTWLKNVKNTLGDKTPSYLIVHHMEPDHSSSIAELLNEYPSTTIVASAKAFTMMKQFFGNAYEDNRIIVKEGDTLSLGKHTLSFFMAPMVHWPEVIVSYDSYDKILFSADAFGKFGTTDTNEDWACEARRYYFGIVGKYGVQASALLKKIKSLDIRQICPLHGPVLNENLDYYLNLYTLWTSYTPEKKGTLIAYTSVYGNTERAVELLEKELSMRGETVSVCDLAREDMAEAVEDAFKYDKMVLASTTYNADLFPFMREFLNELAERNYQKRKVAIIENGSWAPMAKKKIIERLEVLKEIEIIGSVTINSSMSKENEQEIKNLAQALCTE